MRCADCGDFFDALGSWQRLCRGCYAASKRRQEEELRDEIDRLRSENTSLRKRVREAALKPLDRELLKRVLMLCHPDRHANSALSTQVTKVLLAMRDER